MKLVIFDMDGVIFDSERVVYEGWKDVAKRHNFSNLDEPYSKCIGVNAAKAKQIFLDYYGKDFPYDEYKEEQRSAYHAKYDNVSLPLKPGVVELLSHLKNKGYFIAIASSTRTALVEHQIKNAGIMQYFDRIVGGDQVTESKPNPMIFLKAIEGLNILAGDAFVIEDSYNGIRAASAAGMRPIMVPDMLPANDEMYSLAWAIRENLLECIDIF